MSRETRPLKMTKSDIYMRLGWNLFGYGRFWGEMIWCVTGLNLIVPG
jgi:hypothetical protein